MMQYTDKYWKMLMPFIKKNLTKRFGKIYTKNLIAKTDKEYREMLRRADDIGADNPMASNTYECLVFLALWKAAEGRISVDDLRQITHEILSMPILKLMGLYINGNKKKRSKTFSRHDGERCRLAG